MRIPIVNEQDEIIEYKERDLLAPGDIFRVAGLWIYDEEGNILLARRAEVKKKHPGLWAVSVAGTVEEGETYDSNILKEMEEELGITGYTPEFATKDFKDSGIGDNLRRFSTHYKVTMPHDYPFFIKEDEVAEVRWFNPKELEDTIERTPEIFVPTFRQYYKNFLMR